MVPAPSLSLSLSPLFAHSPSLLELIAAEEGELGGYQGEDLELEEDESSADA
jgi:hypothetical protein